MHKPEPWKLLRESLAYNGYRKIARRTYQMPSGRVADFDIKLEGAAVVIFALTEDHQVIIIKEYRPGPDQVIYELPGGGLDRGKEPLAMAEQELLEETGYTGKFQVIGKTYTDAWSDHLKYIVVATECKKVGRQQLGPNEFIEVELVDIKRLREMLRSSEIMDLDSAYLSLDFLSLL